MGRRRAPSSWRGGRLHTDPQSSRWQVSDGYQLHPVYWVTWIGAAAFAAREGARLARRAELAELTASCTGPVASAGYRFADGELRLGPAARWLHGAAWNTPGTPEEIHRPRWRHLAGSSPRLISG